MSDHARETLASGSPAPERAAAKRIIEMLIDGDCGPDANYCWWCHANINGIDGVVEPHADQCRWVEAQQVIALLAHPLPSPVIRGGVRMSASC